MNLKMVLAPLNIIKQMNLEKEVQWKPVIRTSLGVEKHVLITDMF